MDNEKEISFGAFDSELMHQEIYIPEGFEATIDGNKIILKKTESEDEKVRNEIKDIFYSLGEGKIPVSINFAAIFDWLEKQGEQKSVDKVEPTFKVGDWVVTSYGKVNQIVSVDKDGDGYTLDDDTYFSGSWIDGYHLWSIADAKEGDVLVASDESLFIFARTKDNAAYYHYSLCKNGSQEISDGKHAWEVAKDCHPATKEQRDLLFSKMGEAGYMWDSKSKQLLSLKAEPSGEQKPAWSWSEEDERILDGIIYHFSKGHTSTIGQDAWLKTLKDRVQPQPKQEWSEDDDWIRTKIIKVLLGCETFLTPEETNECVYFLKSLKDRYTWKPSDTQMGALLSKLPAIKGSGYEIQCVLETLYDDLKKLKGE